MPRHSPELKMSMSWGWGCSWVVKSLHSMYKALGSIPRTEKKKKELTS